MENSRRTLIQQKKTSGEIQVTSVSNDKCSDWIGPGSIGWCVSAWDVTGQDSKRIKIGRSEDLLSTLLPQMYDDNHGGGLYIYIWRPCTIQICTPSLLAP